MAPAGAAAGAAQASCVYCTARQAGPQPPAALACSGSACSSGTIVATTTANLGSRALPTHAFQGPATMLGSRGWSGGKEAVGAPAAAAARSHSFWWGVGGAAGAKLAPHPPHASLPPAAGVAGRGERGRGDAHCPRVHTYRAHASRCTSSPSRSPCVQMRPLLLHAAPSYTPLSLKPGGGVLCFQAMRCQSCCQRLSQTLPRGAKKGLSGFAGNHSPMDERAMAAAPPIVLCLHAEGCAEQNCVCDAQKELAALPATASVCIAPHTQSRDTWAEQCNAELPRSRSCKP